MLLTGNSDPFFSPSRARRLWTAGGCMAAALLLHGAALTSPQQVHLNAAPCALAAVRAQVRRLHTVQADGEVPPRRSVGEDLHPTLPGFHKLHVALRREVDQDALLDLHPRDVEAGCSREVAGEQNRGARPDPQVVALVRTQLLAGGPIVSPTVCPAACPAA